MDCQQTESGLCSKEHMQEGDEDMQVQAWHLKKVITTVFFFPDQLLLCGFCL